LKTCVRDQHSTKADGRQQECSEMGAAWSVHQNLYTSGAKFPVGVHTEAWFRLLFVC